MSGSQRTAPASRSTLPPGLLETALPPLCVRLLGGFAISRGARVIDASAWRLRKAQSLIKLLALAPGHRLHRERAMELLWPDLDLEAAANNLHQAAHVARGTLALAWAPSPVPGPLLRLRQQVLALDPPAPLWVDTEAFAVAAATARHADDPSAYEAAIALYGGELLPEDRYEDWASGPRETLRATYLALLLALAQLHQSRGAPRPAIAAFQRVLAAEPAHEEAHVQLMRLYAGSGQRHQAMRQYAELQEALRRELDTAPDPASRRLYEEILTGRFVPEPAPPSRPPPVAPHAAPSAGTQGAAGDGLDRPGPGRPADQAPVAALPLIGRRDALAQLQAAWEAATTRPHALLISGEAGIGKTRVAEEALARAGRAGIVTAIARCYAAEGALPFAPLAAWLRTPALWPRLLALDTVWQGEMARIVPELLVERPDLPVPGPLTESWQRHRLFEALARAITPGRSPLLLVLDDLQWCDQETVEWLRYRLRREAEAPLLLALTVRAEDIEPAQPLVALATDLRHAQQLSEIKLGPLDAAETAALAAQIAGQALDEGHAQRLYAATEGHPLVIVETMRAGGPGAAPLPATVQAVLAARLRQLSPAARELVSLAAVIGRAFSFDLLAQASWQDEEALVESLDELWQRQIVREQGVGAYDFSHGKLREVAYAALSPTRRRTLHRRVAQALEVVHAYGLDEVSGQLAAHYEQAGMPEQAVVYYARAAEAAWRVYTGQEAIGYLEHALALLSASAVSAIQQRETALRLQELLGDIRQLTGQIAEARAVYRRALDEPPEPDRDVLHRARIYRKIGKTYALQDQYAEAARAYDQGEEALGQEPAEQTGAPEWWREWFEIHCGRFILHHLRAEMSEMAALLERGRPVVERYGTPQQRVRFLEGALVASLSRERYVVSEEALGYAQAELAAVQESRDAFEIAGAHFQVGYVRLWHGDLDEAEAHLQAALAFAERTGIVEQQDMRGGGVRSLTYLTVLRRKRGRVDETQRLAERSLAAATAAEWPTYMATARANLAWVAWRQGNDAEAEMQAQAALELWKRSPEVYAFQWVALCPLIAVARRQDRREEAIAHARALLDPRQQRLPDTLTVAVEAAIQAADAGQQGAARAHLDQAMALAQEGGFL